jgi:N-acetylmuramoyl-L-alanine amidase
MVMRNKIRLLQVMILIVLSALLIAFSEVQRQETAQMVAISMGAQSSTVKTIQTKLKNWGYFDGEIDGVFGQQTKNAVIKFQKKNGLTPDGIVGKATLEALGIYDTGSSTSGYSESDRNLLARVINGEARGEPFTGQVAVGAVVLNRVEHPSFPNTIAGVVYQPLAFTAVADGQINAEMYESCYRAADMALSGVDPTGGAIYYYNPQTATSEWIFSRPTITTIGKHVFAK